MKKWIIGLVCGVVGVTAAMGQSVVINEYRNATPDVIELVVVEDGLNMQGMLVKDYSSSGVNDGGGAFTFSSDSLWASVPAGTIIVLRKDDSAADTTAGGGDYNLDVGLQNTTYFTAGSGTFDIATEEIIQIKASGSDQAGSTGAIHTFATDGAGAQYDSAPTPKLKSASGDTGTGESVEAGNSTSALSDFNGTDAAGDNSTGTIGTYNNANNQTFIEGLRGPAVFSVSLDKTDGFTVEQGTQDTIIATAQNGTEPYSYEWDTDMAEGDYTASGDTFTILSTAAVGDYYATVTATDVSDPMQTASNTVTFSVAAPQTNVSFTASASSVDENAGTYEITVIKTLAGGDVSGEIVLSGTTTPGDDYTINTTNFTMNGATTSATFTVTIVDDEDEEPAETVVLTLANVAGGTAVLPSVFTLTINASDMGEPTIWLNEINYDPEGTDEADTEWLEVAGPAGVDLSAFVVVLYNGNGGAPYNTTALSGTIDDEGCGYGAVDLVYGVANSLQNGAPDGVALAQVSGGITSLVQF